MPPAELKKKMIEKMEGAQDHLRSELSGIRTGRASLILLDGIKVDYYGTPTPVRQIASLATPEPRLITIQPWEPNLIGEIERAIQASDLGVTPTNDGKIIRLAVPPLSEERRKELVKLAKKLGEETKVIIRNIRRDTNEELKKLHKDTKVTEDELKKGQDEVQKLTDQGVQRVDEIIKKKESEILEV
ncbi:MAG TPA: ribosome recycling factor [Nitrospiria bacterium]|jgi:ribosome recycling factor|nr:ribosome recycling factor [Nitrospiria bacterium]